MKTQQSEDKKKDNVLKIILGEITGIFFPIINIITGVSILKSLVVLLANFNIISSEGGIYSVFYAATDGFFYFLPFFLLFFH